MSEAVKRYSVFIGFEHGEQQMILAADHDRIVAGLRAEVERLRKDAERLDKLQSLAWYRHGFEDDAGVDGLDTLLIDAQGDVRAAIDAALEASR